MAIFDEESGVDYLAFILARMTAPSINVFDDKVAVMKTIPVYHYD
jgi:hypothetical protein